MVAALVVGATPAQATGAQSGSDYAYAGSGYQYAYWNQSAMKLRLVSAPDTGMPNSQCMDAYLDWEVKQPPLLGHNHYDGRIIRSCRPGKYEETDPGGDGTWSEPTTPSNWEGRQPLGMLRGWGYLIDDSSLEVLAAKEPFANSGTFTVASPAPVTWNNGSARVRTRYQNNSVKSCNPLPAKESYKSDCDPGTSSS